MHKRITYESTLAIADCAAACLLLRLPTIKSSDLLFSPFIYVCMHLYSENLVITTSHHKRVDVLATQNKQSRLGTIVLKYAIIVKIC